VDGHPTGDGNRIERPVAPRRVAARFGPWMGSVLI